MKFFLNCSIKQLGLIIALLFCSLSSQATDIFHLNNQPLPLSQAYIFSAQRLDTLIEAKWTMPKGYYLYRDRFCFVLNGEAVTPLVFPPAHRYEDSTLGSFEAYADQVALTFPLPKKWKNQPVLLQVCYQGCTEAHFCYPPVRAQVKLSPNTSVPQYGSSVPSSSQISQSPKDQESSLFKASHSLLFIVISFLLMGVLLSFTPCVLPMLPIMATLILGKIEQNSKRQRVMVALAYVLSMAFTYGIIGVLVANLGENFQLLFQNKWAYGAMALLFLFMALALFGVYELRLPQHWTQGIGTVMNRLPGGKILSAIVMGALAVLILSPCVTPAFVSAVAYVAQSGDYLRGGLALFSLGFGMGLPLVLVALVGAGLLPRRGPWMVGVKHLLGWLVLAISVLLLSKILFNYTFILWGSFCLILSVYLGVFETVETGWQQLLKGIGLISLVLGFGLSFMGLTPLTTEKNTLVKTESSAQWTVVTHLSELDRALSKAKMRHQPVLLDFYAHWCLSCLELDKTVFSQPKIQAQWAKFKRIRVDMTENTPDIQAILNRYQVIAPPTLIFFNAEGDILPSLQIVGVPSALTLNNHLIAIAQKNKGASNDDTN